MSNTQSQEQITFSMIKPDATSRDGVTVLIQNILENNGLKIVAQKTVTLTPQQAEEFYSEHASKPFFKTMISNICKGPVVMQILKGVDAVAKNRKIMGATNPQQAEEGTIRKQFGTDLDFNSIHGSDSIESATRELEMFFTSEEIEAAKKA